MSSSTTTTTQNSAQNVADEATDQQQLVKIGGGSDFSFATLIVTMICSIYDCVTCRDDGKPESITDLTSMACQTDFNILSSSRVLSFLETIGMTGYQDFNCLFDTDEEELKLPRGDEISYTDAQEFIAYIESKEAERTEDKKKQISDKWVPVLQYVMDYCNILLSFNVKDFEKFIGVNTNGQTETEKGLSSKGNYTVKLTRKQKKKKVDENASDDSNDDSNDDDAIEFTETDEEFTARVTKKKRKLALDLTWATHANIIALGRVINWLLVQKKEGDNFVNHKHAFDTDVINSGGDVYDENCQQLCKNFNVKLQPLNLVCDDKVEVPMDPIGEFLTAHSNPKESTLVNTYQLPISIASNSTSQLKAKHGANNDMIEICKNVLLGFFHTVHLDIKGKARKTDSAIVNQFLTAFNKSNNLPADHELHAVYKKEESRSGSKRKRQAAREEAEMVGEERARKKTHGEIAVFFAKVTSAGWEYDKAIQLTQAVCEEKMTWEQLGTTKTSWEEAYAEIA